MAPPRSRALARTRSRSAGYGSKAATQLRNARSALSRQRKKYESSANKAQYSQLAWTMVGGGAGGAASAFLPDGVMGVDPRLVGGVVLAGGCLLLGPKGGAMSRPLCGLAAGMLAAWLGAHTESMLGDDSSEPDPDPEA